MSVIGTGGFQPKTKTAGGGLGSAIAGSLLPSPAPATTPAAAPPSTSAPSAFVEASAEAVDFASWQDLVRERFPSWAWALDHPELSAVLEEAAEKEFTPETFRSQLQATDWWQARTAAQREWDIFTETGSEAELDKLFADTVSNLKLAATDLGANISGGDEAWRALAEQVLRNGMTEQEMTGLLLDAGGSITYGSVTAAQRAIHGWADAYMLGIKDNYSRSLAEKLIRGETTEVAITELFAGQAKERFPGLADVIDRGINLGEYFAPHKSVISEMLGVPEVSVDLANDRRFAPVLGIGSGNQVRPMSLAETGQFVRSLDQYWEDSEMGQTELFGFLDDLSRTMGARR